MISELTINNYKSLHDVTLDVGRFNVLIGENGCGKSNLLEAITFAAAAEADKLDNQFLASRGIRVTEPQLMRSAFEDNSVEKEIKIHVKFKDTEFKETYTLNNDNQPYSQWNRLKKEKLLNQLTNQFIDIEEQLVNSPNLVEACKLSTSIANRLESINNELLSLKDSVLEMSATFFNDRKEVAIEYLKTAKISSKSEVKNFIVYSPENTALRNFNKEGQIEPLGINGEGLFKLLTVMSGNYPEQLEEINACLHLFDWYDGFKIPQDSKYEDKITITDHYLTMDFDQRSANEGFLFVLFYIALMVSDDTPKIFAIDNIDTSLNPKLCTKIIKELIRLAPKYKKQVFVTTHNPAILDGIDLGDDEQRLFVVSRNKTGHTRFKRITLKDKPKSSTNEELRLSEAFLRGYLGGLPKGF